MPNMLLLRILLHNIAAVSNIAVQLFEHMYGPEFRVIPEATSSFLTKQFALLRPISFLLLMASVPRIPTQCTSFQRAAADYQLFEALRSGYDKFKKAMKLFAQRKQNEDDGEE